MAAPSRIYDLSATASSNTPSGTEAVGTGLDDYLRGIQAVIRGDLATKGADIASAATTDLGAVQGLFHDITGTTTITSFGTVAAGVWKVLKFEGALTLTHNAASLVLPGAANITTADGDIAIVVSEGSGNWRCVLYQKASGQRIGTINALTEDSSPDETADYVETWDASASAHRKVKLNAIAIEPGDGTVTNAKLAAGALFTSAAEQASTSGTAIHFTGIPSGTQMIVVTLEGVSTNGAGAIQVQIGDAGGLETSGYIDQVMTTNSNAASTSGFQVTEASAAGSTWHAMFVLTLSDAANNTWVCMHNSTEDGGSQDGRLGSGSKSLSAVLDRVSVISGDTFDAGAISIMYR